MKTKILYIAHSGGLQGAGIALINTLKGILSFDIIPIVILPCKGDMYNQLKQLDIKTYVIPYDMDIYPPHATFKDYVYFLPNLNLNIRY